jgi:hypothetical protein
MVAVVMTGLTVGAWVSAGLGRPESLGSGRRALLAPYARALGVTIAVLAAIAFWGQIWGFASARNSERKQYAKADPVAQRFMDAASGDSNQAFLNFVRPKLGRGDTFAIAPAAKLDDQFVRQWTTYVLSPHLLVQPENADWLLILSSNPKTVSYDRQAFGKSFQFDKKNLLLRRTDEG